MEDSKDSLLLEIERLKGELKKSNSTQSIPVGYHPEIRLFFDNLNIGVLQFNKNFKITLSNNQASKLLGVDSEKLLGTSFWNTQWKFLNENCEVIPKKEHPAWKIKYSQTDTERIAMILEQPSQKRHWIEMQIKYLPAIDKKEEGQFLAIFHNTDKQKRDEIELKQRLKLEKAVTNISTHFTLVDHRTIDFEINKALDIIGSLSMVDRSYVFLYSEDKTTMSNTHEWCSEGTTAEIENLKDLPVDVFPWWTEKLKKKEVIYFQDISAMPQAASAEKEILEAQSILSVLVVPITKSEETIGFMGFDSVKNPKEWSDSDIRLLRLVAEIFGNAYMNIELNEKIKAHNEHLEKLVEIRTREKEELSILNTAIIQTTGAIIFSTNEQGIIQTFNPKAEEILGYKASELIGKISVVQLQHPDDLEFKKQQIEILQNTAITNNFEAILQSRKYLYPNPFEFNFITKSGQTIPVLLTLSAVKNKKNKTTQYVGVAIDYRFKKEAEKAIKLQVAAFESFIYALVITDAKGQVLWANKSYEKLTGYSINEIIGDEVGKLQKSGFHSAGFYKNMWDSYLKGEAWHGELINRRKDGSLYTEEMTTTPIKNAKGEIVYFVAVKIDISEKKEQERLQKEQEKINEVILNMVPDLLFRINKKGKYLNVFTSDPKNLFLPKEQFLGKTINQILPAELAKQSMEALNKAFKKNKIVSYQYHLNTGSKILYFENRIIAISKDEALSIIRDITETRTAETALKTTMLQLNTLVESMQIGTLFESPQRKVALVNSHFCKLFDIPVSPSQLIGSNCIDGANATAMLMQQPEKFISDIEITLKNKEIVTNAELFLTDGRVFERDYIPIHSSGKLLGHLWQYRDITERKTRERYRLLQRELGFNLSKTSTLKTALLYVIEAVLKIDDINASGIYMVDSKTGKLKLEAIKGIKKESVPFVKEFNPEKDPFKKVLQGDSVFEDYREIKENSTLYKKEKLYVVGIVPLKSRNKVIGALNIVSYKQLKLTMDAKNTLESIASQIGGALARINSQNELLLSKENFQLMFNTFDDFMFILDENGNIIKTNPIVEDRLGYTKKELFGMPVTHVHPPARRNEAALIVGEMLEGKREICPVPLYTKTGNLIPVETKVIRGKWDGKDALYGISRDISEQIKAQEKLQKSEARWQFALESSGDGIWDWNLKTNQIFYSEQYKNMLGYSNDEFNDNLHSWPSKIHPDDLDQVYKDLDKHINQIAPIYENEHRVICKNGSYKWVLDRGKIISRDEDGNPERIIGTQTDISIRKNYEVSLIEALQKEKELGELKSRFVSMTSHEFRTPLATILVSADSLYSYIDRMTVEEQKSKIAKIKSNVEFLRKIIEKVLNLSSVESGNLKFFPVKTEFNIFISNLIEEFKGNVNPKQKIKLRPLKSSGFIAIDQLIIKQVITNLISNAVKYSPENSEIKIELKAKKTNLLIEVSDNGIGINEKDKHNIFTPFQRGTNVGNVRGTGLGLALSKQFVLSHGGNLTFKSEINKGSTFTVLLPGISFNQ